MADSCGNFGSFPAEMRTTSTSIGFLETGYGGTSLSSSTDTLKSSPTSSFSFTLPPTRVPGAPIFTPTPDPPRVLPTLRSEQEEYILQPGDTIGKVAQMFNVDIQTLVEANQIANPNLVPAGLKVIIPAPSPQPAGTSFKVIPDSELVFSPAAIPFDVFAFVRQQGGYLFSYRET